MYSIFILIIAIFSYFFADRTVAENLIIPQNFRFICKYLSNITDPFYLLTLSIFVFLICLTIKHFNYLRINAFLMLVTISMTMFSTGNLKILTRRPRPLLYLKEGAYGFFMGNIESSFLSFPSSHASVDAAVATLLIYWFPYYKKWVYLMVTPLIIIRVLLQKHFVSDLIIGSLLGYLVAKLVIKYGIENKKAPKFFGGFLKIKPK